MKILGVACDDSGLLGQNRFIRIPKKLLEVSDIDERRLELIPIYTTPPALQAAANKGNLQFDMAWVKPGQQVERSVDLPRGMPTELGYATHKSADELDLPKRPFSQPEYAEPSAEAPDGLLDLPAEHPEPEYYGAAYYGDAQAAQIQSDDAKAKELLGVLNQLKQAQDEVQQQINALVRKRTDLETEERQTRKELRVVWTQPLDFEEKPDVPS